MRLSLKLGLATAFGICLILGVYGALRLRRENAAFEREVRRDHETLGRAVALLAETAVERGGLERALQLVQDANTAQQHVTIRYRPDVDARPGSPPRSRTVRLPEGRALITSVPVQIVEPGFVELVEPLRDEDNYLAETLHRTVGVTLALLALSSAIIFFTGWWLVGRPMRLLASKARRIGEGDLSGPLRLRQRDEIGELAREINSMCERIGQAQARVAAEAAARDRAVDQLRHAERLATVGKLAAGIAHELGTPLNVAGARAKMIARGESQGDEVRGDAEVIHQQVERMVRIIRQLLDFARPRPPQRSRTDLTSLIESTLDLLSSTGAKSGVRLRNPAALRCEADVDVMQLQQVLANLVMNGIHAQPGGGEVRVWAQPEPGGASLFVEDDGGGMTEEIQRRVFEPFFTTKDPGQGTGLGLSVVHGIVEEHGGRISARSSPAGGTRMHIYLPATS